MFKIVSDVIRICKVFEMFKMLSNVIKSCKVF